MNVASIQGAATGERETLADDDVEASDHVTTDRSETNEDKHGNSQSTASPEPRQVTHNVNVEPVQMRSDRPAWRSVVGNKSNTTRRRARTCCKPTVFAHASTSERGSDVAQQHKRKNKTAQTSSLRR